MKKSCSGRVTRAAGGSGPLVFTYDEPYAHGPAAVPLSLSMPLPRRRFADARVQGWMEGLLPGHSRVRSHWAAKHGAASVGPFDLLSTKVGLECAGAVRIAFIRSERFSAPSRLSAEASLERQAGAALYKDESKDLGTHGLSSANGRM